MGHLGMFEDALSEFKKREGSTPIRVLDMSRSSCSSDQLKRMGCQMDTFGKMLSSDSSLCHLMICVTSEEMAVTLDHGYHPHRQERLWVSEFSEEEAMEFLTLRGLGDKTAEFLLRQKLNVLFPSSKVAPRFAKSQKVFFFCFLFFFGFSAFRLSVLIFWQP